MTDYYHIYLLASYHRSFNVSVKVSVTEANVLLLDLHQWDECQNKSHFNYTVTVIIMSVT